MKLNQSEWKLMHFMGCLYNTVYELNLIMSDVGEGDSGVNESSLEERLTEVFKTYLKYRDLPVFDLPGIPDKLSDINDELCRLHILWVIEGIAPKDLRGNLQVDDMDWQDLPIGEWLILS